MANITVFICEDDIIAKEIIEKYFQQNGVTYAEKLSADKRGKVVKALDLVG